MDINTGRRRFGYFLFQVILFSAVAAGFVYWDLTGVPGGIFSASVIYYFWLVNTRRFLLPDHWKGIKAMKRGDWERAASCFRRSMDYLERHAYLDRYRFFFLMSISSYSYREMEWSNLGFTLGKIGDLQEAYTCFKMGAEEFPENYLLLRSLENIEVDLHDREIT